MDYTKRGKGQIWLWGYNLSNPALKPEPKECATILDVTYEKKNMLLQSPCYNFPTKLF